MAPARNPSALPRRNFLKKTLALGASFALSESVSAKARTTLKPLPAYDGLLSKTEEFQESFLSALPDSEKRELLDRIAAAFPDAFAKYASGPLVGHLLRTGYVALSLGNLPLPGKFPTSVSATAQDVLVPFSSSILRSPAPGNASYRASFAANMPRHVEPFDLIPAETRAIAINGNYGVFEDGRCREHTWDGKSAERFLLLSHGDVVEIPAMDAVRNSDAWLGTGIRMPKAAINAATGTPLCSQVARTLGESFWLPFARGDSALASLRLYAKTVPRFSDFLSVPEKYARADVFMRSASHPLFGHRAFAFRDAGVWMVVDPYSHAQPISAAQYRRRSDIVTIVAFA